MTTRNAIAIPAHSGYGAIELKELTKKYTLEAFVAALSIMTVLLLLYLAFNNSSGKNVDRILIAPIVKGDVFICTFKPDLPLTPAIIKLPAFGIKEIAGNPVPVPETTIKSGGEFTPFEKLANAMSHPGNNENVPFSTDVNLTKQTVNVFVHEDELPPDIFIPVEKEPYIDLAELQKRIVYPKLAIAAGVQGKVIVRVLVNKEGSPVKSIIEYSENELLNEAAVNAVMKSVFIPAIQNNSPVSLWVSIPVQFRVR